ncbi:hypothetical protein GCM10010300_25370 [Streptomyces olivaceoviridis]|nr:hypothetical protein GCM10010300_25370 [Streptomyces olivaceoviridis]
MPLRRTGVHTGVERRHGGRTLKDREHVRVQRPAARGEEAGRGADLRVASLGRRRPLGAAGAHAPVSAPSVVSRADSPGTT